MGLEMQQQIFLSLTFSIYEMKPKTGIKEESVMVQQNGFTLYTCPFCKARTLVTNKEKDAYTCFSCGRTGKISEERNVKENELKEETPKEDIFFDIYEAAASFYYISLHSDNSGSRYFRKRNIIKEDVDEFGLGFAPEGYTNLYDKLKKSFSDEELLSSGLFRQSERGRIYDFFRNRVMFPIFDKSERVVAFGGRVLDDSKPKYINSSESEFFSKRKLLYGFPYNEPPRSDTIFICEGYMDLIAMKKAGIRDSAAVLGTALTKAHVKLIASRYKKVCLGLDSDAAGLNAIKRSLWELMKYGLEVTIPSFSPEKDPDEFLQKNGKEALLKRISEAEEAKRFIAKHLGAKELLSVLLSNTD